MSPSIWRITAPLLFLTSTASIAPAAPQRTGTPGEEPGPVTEMGTPRAKGDRVLAMALTLPEDDDFDASLGLAQGAGMEATGLDVFWDDLEVAPFVYAPNPNWLAIADAYYPAKNVRILFGVHPIDTNNLRVPADLAGLPFDHPTVIQRFRALLTWVFAQVPNLDLIDLAIGNEIDASLATPAAWAEYEAFFRAAASHARLVRPGIDVGTKATFSGLTGTSAPLLQSMNEHADVLLATYYPLNPDFTVRPPRVVSSDMRLLLGLYPDLDVHLREAGYPEGPLCQSSVEMQARFVRRMFESWDEHATRLRVIEWVWMHDLSEAALQAYELYYGVSDPVFLEYLGTLGLRTFDGSGVSKPAYRTWEREAARRGW